MDNGRKFRYFRRYYKGYWKNYENFRKKFCKSKNYAYLCNPKVKETSFTTCGCGEMVDTLLWGGSGRWPVWVRVSPSALKSIWISPDAFFVYTSDTPSAGAWIEDSIPLLSYETQFAQKSMTFSGQIAEWYFSRRGYSYPTFPLAWKPLLLRALWPAW